MYIKEILQLKKYNYLNEIVTFSNCVSHICNKIIHSIKIIKIPIFFTRLKKGIITLTNNKKEREREKKSSKRRTRPGHSASITRNPRWKDIIKDQRASSRSAINYSCNDSQQPRITFPSIDELEFSTSMRNQWKRYGYD